MDESEITATKFLEAAYKAAQNAGGELRLGQIVKDVKRSPRTEQRLTFEFLEIALHNLDNGVDPGLAVGWAMCGSKSIEHSKIHEYLCSVEKIVSQCFELMPASGDPAKGSPFRLSLLLAAKTLKRLDRERFLSVRAELKRRYGEQELDRRWAAIREIEAA